MAQGNVAGGATVGAVTGGLMGAVIGWLLGAQMTAVPVIGPLTGSGVLASVLGGLVAGAGIGALIGALVGSFSPQDVPPVEAPAANLPARETGVVSTEPVASTWEAGISEPVPVPAVTPAYDGADHALDESSEAAALTAAEWEDSTMDEMDDSESGRNPETFTGTEDAIDPGTGALGTAGTPISTGYGVSGSTIGTGSASGEAAQRNDDFRGATPDTKSYEAGGRGSGDSDILRGDERTLPAESRYANPARDEAPVQREPADRDVYETSPGYGESVTRGGLADTAPEGTGTTGVDADPPQASAGTNIPGTSDPRGLGDNTDDTGDTR